MMCDLHLHSIASGHGTTDTITDLARAGADRQLKLIGITDHGPATLHAAAASYFQGLPYAPKKRFGVSILYGAELNILDNKGTVDLDDRILAALDYAIISMHPQNLRPGSASENTSAYIHAMNHPKVKIIGHCDDPKYPVNYEELLSAARQKGVIFEINNASLIPNGYRGDTYGNIRKILKLCKKSEYPILLSSDSHGRAFVGDFCYAARMLEETNFPRGLVLNHFPEEVLNFINK